MNTDRPNRGSIEVRFVGRNSAPTMENGKLSGRAAPFNRTAMIGKTPWGFREKISPGAFAKSLKDGDIVLLDNHDSAKPIARQSAGTLTLAETKGGLDWEATPADTTYAHDVVENARAGNYGGCSFGFEVIKDSWKYNKEDDVDERTLHEVKLHEISVCTFPAYGEGTSVSARDQVKAAKEARDAFYVREYEVWVTDGISDDDIRDGNAPYGNVAYADPGYQKDKKKRYPIDTKAHCKAAWSYINKKSNQAPYTSQQLASIKSKIKSACNKFGVKISDSSGKNAAQFDGELRDFELETQSTGSQSTTQGVAMSNNAAKLLAKVREVAFDESRSEEPGAQLTDIRRLLLEGLVRDTEEIMAAMNKAERKLAKAKRKAQRGDPYKVGQGGFAPITDGDSDDPICPACHGSGKGPGGVSMCAGGCAGTGRLAGGGDNDATSKAGPHQDSSFGFGLGSGGASQGNNPASGSSGDGHNPAVGSPAPVNFNHPSAGSQGNAPAAGNPGGGSLGANGGNNPPLPSGSPLGNGQGLKYSQDFSGAEARAGKNPPPGKKSNSNDNDDDDDDRPTPPGKKGKKAKKTAKKTANQQNQNGNGQPGSSTDREGAEDSARLYRARLMRARMRRDEFDAEANE